MKDLFDCIDILLNRVISGKEKKYAKACWVELNKEAYKSIFEKFSFGRVHNYGYVENTWYGFFLKNVRLPSVNIFLNTQNTTKKLRK